MKNFELTTIKYESSDKTKEYAEEKLQKLVKYLPKNAQESAFMKVTLEELSKKRDDKFKVEINLEVPEKKVLTVVAKELTMEAAIDSAKDKMKAQINRYKTETNPHLGKKKGSLRRIKERFMKKSR